MARKRRLLSIGNGKLGEQIAHWDLPAVDSCPGASEACLRHCYARKSRFLFTNVIDRLTWCLRQSRRSDFADLMVKEIRQRGILNVRWHVSGDVYDACYGGKLYQVMERLPRVCFYLYSRSWRIPEIEPVLRRMALLANCVVWYSLDCATGSPAEKPPGVRYCYMQDSPEVSPDVDLIFRVRSMVRSPRVGLPMVCPTDTPAGRKAGANCGSCAACFTK